MNAISVAPGASPTLVAAGGNRNFLHIYNNSASTVYLCYDCDTATATSTLATTNGFPLVAGAAIMLNNDNLRGFGNPVYAVHADGSNPKELRIQGA